MTGEIVTSFWPAYPSEGQKDNAIKQEQTQVELLHQLIAKQRQAIDCLETVLIS